MSGLEEIKARAAAPDKVLEWADVYSDEYTGAVQASQADVPKLVALIEKIRDEATERADQYQATADRLWALAAARHPEGSSQDATRYSAYASLAAATAYIIDKTIKEGLTQ